MDEEIEKPCCFNLGKQCAALTQKQCVICSKCAFRKTAAELQAGREKARRHIEILPEIQRNYILSQYYGSNANV